MEITGEQVIINKERVRIGQVERFNYIYRSDAGRPKED